MIDGKRYILIPAGEDMEINGMTVEANPNYQVLALNTTSSGLDDMYIAISTFN